MFASISPTWRRASGRGPVTPASPPIHLRTLRMEASTSSAAFVTAAVTAPVAAPIGRGGGPAIRWRGGAAGRGRHGDGGGEINPFG